MSWKCVLVGLALVLPGFLLIVEGRDSEEIRGGRHKRSFLTKLGEVIGEDGAIVREGYSNGEDTDPALNKNSETNAANSRQAVRDEVRGNSNNAGQMTEQELNVDGNSPVALPLEASQKRQNSNAHEEIGLFGSTVGFITIVTGCTVLAAVGIIGAGVCWYKYHKAAKAASDVEYPAYGVTGPTKDRLPSPGDRKLAQSAQMYHYQHQKQQMIAMEKANGDMKHDASDDESEEDNVEGDYTVYECPGLAPTGEMEVKNPLFRGDETPSTPANEDDQQHPGAGNN